MGRRKKIENVIKELVKMGEDEKALVNLVSEDRENVVRALYEELTSDKNKEAEEAIAALTEMEQSTSVEVFESSEDMIEEEEDISAIQAEPSTISEAEDIMALFNQEELEGDNPNVAGLRRVSRLVIGPVVDQDVQIVPIVMGRYNGISAVMKISFSSNNENFGTGTLTFSDAGDCIPEYNADSTKFGRYATALAVTRAEARILRKALGLANIAAEEATDLPAVKLDGEGQDNSLISDQQKKLINKLAEKKNVKIEEFMAAHGFDKTDIDLITKDEAILLIKKLNEKKETK